MHRRLWPVPLVLAAALLLSACGAATAEPSESDASSDPPSSTTPADTSPADNGPTSGAPDDDSVSAAPAPDDAPRELFPLTVGGPVPEPYADPALVNTPNSPAPTPDPDIPDPIRSTPLERAELMEPPPGLEADTTWVPPHWSDPDTQERGWVSPAFAYQFVVDAPTTPAEGYEEEFDLDFYASFSVTYVGDVSDIRDGISLYAKYDSTLEQSVIEVAGYPAVLTVPAGGGTGLYRIEMALHGELILVENHALVVDGTFYGLDAEQLADMAAQYLEVLYGEDLAT